MKEMSSPIHRQVLTPKKPIWVYRLEQRIAEQDNRIKMLEEALEESVLENRRLRADTESNTVPVPVAVTTGSPQFRLSL